MLSTYAQQTMVDTLPVAACVFTGEDFIISAANNLMLAIWDSDAGVIGQKLSMTRLKIKEETFYVTLQEAYGKGIACRDGEVAVRRILGEGIAYLDISYKPLRDRNGLVYGVVTTAVDITDKIIALKQLEQNVEELAATNEELSALNEEYLSLNEELEAGSEELQAANRELMETHEKLRGSMDELRRAEERIRMAAVAANLGVFDLDMQTGQLVSSERLAEIFGVAQDAPRSSFRSAIHPDDRDTHKAAHAQAILNGRLFYELRVLRSDGSIRWVKAEGEVTFDGTGKAVRLLGVLQDVTGQRQDKEIQRKLKTLSDNSADLMSLLELDGVNSYINAAGKKLLGFESDEEVLQTPIAALHRPEDFEQVSREVLPTVMDKGKWVGTMLVRHLKTGEVFPVLNYTIRIDDPDTGKPIGIGAIMRDLRPELAARKALADSEQLLSNITSAAPIALWMAGRNGGLRYVNRTWELWTGRDSQSHLGAGWLDSIRSEDRRKVARQYQAALADKQTFDVEFRMIDAAGRIRWCQATGHPQFDSDGVFAGYIGACIDLTMQKEIQQHKDDFISIASHELKTPVTSLKVSLQLLESLKAAPGHSMYDTLLAQALNSSNRVENLIDDLLNVGRLQQKQIELRRSVFRLAGVIERCARLTGIAGKKQIYIAGDTALKIFADEGRIEQVVTNFLTNAVKYAPDSDQIDVVISVAANEAKVSVTDYGPGIPADKTNLLFSRYYRVENFRHISGLGLGLYISKEIVERHGGCIGCVSETGKGSTFWFTLKTQIPGEYSAFD